MLFDKSDKKRIPSSAYNDILCSWSSTVMPDKLASALDMAKGSMAKMNNSRERGQPWWVDLSNVNGLDRLLFVITRAVGLIYNNSIHYRNFQPYISSPYLGSKLNKYGHSILSNACLTSRDKNAISLVSLLEWIMLRTLLMLWNPYAQTHSDHYVRKKEYVDLAFWQELCTIFLCLLP